MPKYEINGKIYEFESEPTTEDIDFLAGSEKTRTKWYEDIGAGARDVGKAMAHGIALGAAGLTTGERQQEILGNIQDLRKSQQADEAGLDRGESGKVLKAVGALPAFLNPVTGGMAIAGGAAETGMQLADDGAGAGTALAGMGADAGINLATMGLAGKAQVAGKAANALLQGGVNVGQEALLNHPVQNLIRSNAGLKDLPDLTIGDVGAAALPGMAIGAMTAKPKVPTSKDPALTEVAPKTVADLDASYVERKTAILNSIEDQLVKKTLQQEDLMRNGSMSEKQLAWYQKLEQQKDVLKLEHKKTKDNLAKYQKPVEQTGLTEAEQIAQLDLSFIDEMQKTQLGIDTLPTEDDFHQLILAEQERIRNTMPTGEAFRDDVTVDTTLTSSKGTGDPVLGQNQNGKSLINPEYAKELFDSLTPEQQFSFGSARGLQLFAEIHEATHNLVKRKDGEPIKDYERRMNDLIAAEWKAQGLDQGEPGTRRISRKLLNEFDKLVAERAAQEEAPVTDVIPFFDEIPKGGSLVEFSPDGSRVYPNDKARLKALRTSLGGVGKKQGGAVLNPAQVLDAVKESVAKMHNTADIANNIDVTNLKTSDELIVDQRIMDGKDIGSGRISRNFFGIGQLVEGLKREAPLVWEAFKRIKIANDAEVQMKRRLWSGDGSGMSPKGMLQFMKLKHYDDPETLAQVVPRLTPEQMVKTFEYVQENSNKLQQHDRGDMSTFTPIEKKAVLLLKKMYDDVKNTTGLRQRNGYIHAFHKGEFAIGLRTSQGDVEHIETFPTAKIAQEFKAEAMKLGHDTTDLIDFKTEAGMQLGESFGIVKDILENTFSKDPNALNTTLKTLDEIQQRIADNATVGKHNVRKEGYTGFAGTRLLKSREQNAREFWNSVEDYIGQVSSQHKKTLLNRSRTDFWENDAGRELAQKFPNQKQLSDFLYDHAANSLNKYGLGEWVDQVRPMMDNLFADTVKATIGVAKKIPIVGKKITMDERFYYPDVSVVDKTTGMAAQLFYISALTTRPGFWVGQLLSAPFAVRQFLKEGTVLDTIVASGKGWGTIMSGGDAAFKTFMKDMVNKTGSTHPQFKNEINEIPFFNSKQNNTLNKLFEFSTGQTFGGMADSVSRYFTIATAYHHYKALGMTGEALFRNVQNAVDNTMVMYSRDQSSPMFSRLGLVGQHVAPLQKYSVAQLGNLIGDFKYIAQQEGGLNKIRATIPAISTLMTTMIMAGSIGLPLLAEYELLRKGLVWANEQFGLGMEDYIPKSVYENMLSNKNVIQSFAASAYEGAGASPEFAKDASNFGVLSASTGFDLGSSLRFNPYLPGTDGSHQGSLVNSFPVIKFALDAASSVLTHTKKYTGADTSLAEQRKADMQIQVFPGQRYLVDKLKYDSDNRLMVPGGARDYGQVEQTPQEQIGQALGSPTISTVKTKLQNQIELEKDKKRAALRQKATDMMVDSIATGDKATRERALDLAVKADMTHKTFKEAVRTASRQRVTDRETARLVGKKGYPKSHDQLVKYLEMQQYE